jgi:hypothetical protein
MAQPAPSGEEPLRMSEGAFRARNAGAGAWRNAAWRPRPDCVIDSNSGSAPPTRLTASPGVAVRRPPIPSPDAVRRTDR